MKRGRLSQGPRRLSRDRRVVLRTPGRAENRVVQVRRTPGRARNRSVALRPAVRVATEVSCCDHRVSQTTEASRRDPLFVLRPPRFASDRRVSQTTEASRCPCGVDSTPHTPRRPIGRHLKRVHFCVRVVSRYSVSERSLTSSSFWGVVFSPRFFLQRPWGVDTVYELWYDRTYERS